MMAKEILPKDTTRAMPYDKRKEMFKNDTFYGKCN